MADARGGGLRRNLQNIAQSNQGDSGLPASVAMNNSTAT
jgi:hypothetical protein